MSVLYCCVHRGPIGADTRMVLVSAIEQGSGPGIGVYACDPCVTRYGITPFAELPADGAPAFGEPPLGVRRAP